MTKQKVTLAVWVRSMLITAAWFVLSLAILIGGNYWKQATVVQAGVAATGVSGLLLLLVVVVGGIRVAFTEQKQH